MYSDGIGSRAVVKLIESATQVWSLPWSLQLTSSSLVYSRTLLTFWTDSCFIITEITAVILLACGVKTWLNLLHRNFITCIGHRCTPESSLNCQHCVFDHERWTSHSTFLTHYTHTNLRACSIHQLKTCWLYLVVKLFGGHRFSVAAPRVWNSLPQELRNCETLGTFKKHLKTHLFLQDII